MGNKSRSARLTPAVLQLQRVWRTFWVGGAPILLSATELCLCTKGQYEKWIIFPVKLTFLPWVVGAVVVWRTTCTDRAPCAGQAEPIRDFGCSTDTETVFLHSKGANSNSSVYWPTQGDVKLLLLLDWLAGTCQVLEFLLCSGALINPCVGGK